MLSKPHSRLLRCLIQIAQAPCEGHAHKFYRSIHPRVSCHFQRRSFHATSYLGQVVSQETQRIHEFAAQINLLPRTCPGCGALTHNDASNRAGYYGRQAIKDDLKRARRLGADRGEPAQGEEQEREHEAQKAGAPTAEDKPVRDRLSQALCDRCTDLSHQKRGTSIIHPTVESIAAIIDESPFQDNHVYLVLDAADFPASLIPNVFDELSLVQQRSQNRRAKSTMYKRGNTTTISFIITRSDILLPAKEQIDRLMPYFVQNLRAALGKNNERARMGNVHLVSSKRGWWTKELKEEIRQRGGANWMVGKVNVGKSNLFEVVYPKGTTEAEPDFEQLRADAAAASEDVSSILLPPAQPLVPYPSLPLVSSLPGTTASPIRLPFISARGKLGELIDLPGLFRSPLENYIEPRHQQSMVMNKSPKVDSISLRPQQSLLIGGGLVRITPDADYNDSMASTSRNIPKHNPQLVIQAHPFLPVKVPVHVTATKKCLEMEQGIRTSGIESLLSPSALSNVSLAAKITLDKDVTSSYAARLLQKGPRKERRFQKAEDLPFRVFAADVVIEGIGWVELTAQVRIPKHRLDRGRVPMQIYEDEFQQDGLVSEENDSFASRGGEHGSIGQKADSQGIRFPRVLVYTPGGKGIVEREPAEIWNTIVHSHKPKTA